MTTTANVSERGWARRARALSAFLAEPRTRPQIVAWAAERGMSGARLEGRLEWLREQPDGGTFLMAVDARQATWRWYRSE
ncbi:MAG TPA: hypothetical protein VL400_14550 [Polyangiaceae bacterium]|nr:hypothetical protein [Polyangiaceae bacterium]